MPSPSFCAFCKPPTYLSPLAKITMALPGGKGRCFTFGDLDFCLLRSQHCSLSVNESTNLRKIKTKVRTRSQQCEMQAILYRFIDCKIHLPSFLFQCRFSPFFWQFGTFRLHLIGFCGFGGGNSKTPTALSTCPPYFMAFKPKSKMPSGIFSVKKEKADVDDTFTALQAF